MDRETRIPSEGDRVTFDPRTADEEIVPDDKVELGNEEDFEDDDDDESVEDDGSSTPIM
jgi:hypothetical protein